MTSERRGTAQLLGRVLGEVIADRYVDFCKLAYGQHGLRVSVPVVAHALRELDSIFRGALEEFSNDAPRIDAEESARQAKAREALGALGYDQDVVSRAIKELTPRSSHKAEIMKIARWLGFPDDSSMIKDWLSVSNAHRMAHERKFNRVLHVHEDFRRDWADPFDHVIREIARALQPKFSALVLRVDALACEKDITKALAGFEKQNIGAMSVQRHFFQTIEGPAWLPELINRQLVAEPSEGTPDEDGNPTFREWSVGHYLQRIANSDDPATLERLSAVISSVSASTNPDVRRVCASIIAKLPTAHSGKLIEYIIGWLPGAWDYGVTSSAIDLLKKLVGDDTRAACLKLATALFEVVDHQGEIGSAFPRPMYEHHLAAVHPALSKTLDLDALRLFTGLLYKSALIERKIRLDPYMDFTSVILEPLSGDNHAAHDIFRALTAATMQCAFSLIDRQDTDAAAIVDILLKQPYRLAQRIALLTLSRKPQALPDRAEAFLLDRDFVEADNMRYEYAALATAWFPRLSPERQAELLALVDAIPHNHVEGWRKRFAEYEKRDPTPDEEERFFKCVIRDATWHWRSVLPQDRQSDLARTVEAWGDPDAWMSRAFGPSEVSPMTPADFQTTSMEEIVRFLAAWAPDENAPSQTKSALGRDLRAAVEAHPQRFSSGAVLFATLPPIYVLRLIEGLRARVQNKVEVNWPEIIELIRTVTPHIAASIAGPVVENYEDAGWFEVAMEIGELISFGFRFGAEGVPLAHDDVLRAFILACENIAPPEPERRDFYQQIDEHPYFTAGQTMLGTAVELNIIRLFWLSKQPGSAIYSEQRTALAVLSDFPEFAARVLASGGGNGRVVRAIFGRYLNWLVHFGEEWVKANVKLIFPDDEKLSEAAWHSHLLSDNFPAKSLMAELSPFYEREIATLKISEIAEKRHHRQERLTEYLLVLYLWGVVEKGLMDAFWAAAPTSSLRHALWFLGRELGCADLDADIRMRAESYWEARISAAEAAPDKDQFRGEISAIGGWAINIGISSAWLLAQMRRALDAGFAPSNSYMDMVIEWGAKIAEDHAEAIIPLIEQLASNPHTDAWAFVSQQAEIRTILIAGQASQSLDTRNGVERIIGILASKGDTRFLDLMRGAA